MLKRFWNYQLLLGGSMGLANDKKPSKLILFSIFIYILCFVYWYA